MLSTVRSSGAPPRGVDDPFGLLGAGASPGFEEAIAAAALVASGLAAGAPAPEAPLPPSPPPWESPCPQCGGEFRRGVGGVEYVCAGCGLVAEGDLADPEDDDAPRAAPNAARLRIVGPGSSQLQPDLYRSSSGNTAATQRKQIYEEYCAYRQMYIEQGGRAFPLDACSLAADFYNEVQRQCVKRSQNKKKIMAACLFHGCLEIGFSPSKAEISAFMQLASKGIASGVNFVLSLVADGKMDVDVNVDHCLPEITTLFAHLGLEGPAYAGLREAVRDLVQTAIDNSIGTSSVLRTKVYGATYVALRRCRDRALVPNPPTLQEFCQDRIRKNTLDRLLKHFENYHSYFKPCYERAGLDSGLQLK